MEVEGTRYEDTILKMSKSLSSKAADLQRLDFGIFLAYAYSPQGKGQERCIPPLPLERFVELGKAVTRENPGKQLAILTLEKKWERVRSGPRARNEWYMGTPDRIQGVLLTKGEEIARRTLASSEGRQPLSALNDAV